MNDIMQRVWTTLLLLSSAFLTDAAFDLGWKDDTDLTSFVTRPEIRAPLFSVAFYEPELVTPGYWFIGPYAEISQKAPAPKYYHPCQTGPHIYDGYGNLVWSGACQVRNQNACDFRAWNINGTDFLSAILYKNVNDPIGRGLVLDNSYQIQQEILTSPEQAGMNMHELELVNGGTAALHLTFRPEIVNITDLPNEAGPMGWIMNMGIREVDLQTGKTEFEWWAYPEVRLNESNVAVTEVRGPFPNAWNFFHGNSITKNAAGDYLISSRFTDTIYKISGSEGRIVWRLGGRASDFDLQGFNFSRQHDAQWIEAECDDDHETITFLDNGSDGTTHTSNISSALKVRLDLNTMSAHVLQRWERPDEKRSNLRGNFQTLPSGNVFAAWSDNSFLSEHTSDGELVMAAEFMSERFVTYRAYKFNFTGNPIEPPVMKAFAYGVDEASSTTVVYVSWNGATEVESWDLYAVRPDMSTGMLLGSFWKSGFETRHQLKGYEGQVYAEAIDKNGNRLGHTAISVVERPVEWDWDWESVHVGADYRADPPQQQALKIADVKTEL